jgi:hypothetical protein
MATIKTANGNITTSTRIILSRKVSDIGSISSVQGSLTRAFSVEATNVHRQALGVAMNLSKPVQNRLVECSVFDKGVFLFAGLLAVEKVRTDVIECRIYEGNTEWIARLKGVSLKDLDLGTLRYSPANVGATQSARSGAFWGVFNTGVNDNTLFFNQKTVLDVLPCMFVKDIIARAFSFAGVAVKGDLWENPDFESLVLVLGDKIVSQPEDIDVFDAEVTTFNNVTVNEIAVPLATTSIVKDSAYLTDNAGSPEFVAGTDMVIRLLCEYEINDVTKDARFLVLKNNVVAFQHFTFAAGLEGEFGVYLSLQAGDTLSFQFIIDSVSGSMTVETTSLRVVTQAVGEFDVSLTDFTPDIELETIINYALNLFAGLSSYNSNTTTVTLSTFDNIAAAPVQDVSELIDTRSIEQDFTFDLGFENTINYAETENEESIGGGLFIIDKSFLQRTNEFLTFDFAGSYYRLSRSLSETLVGQNYFRENTVIPFEVSEPVVTTAAPRFEVGDKFVIYPFGGTQVNVNDLNQLEAFEVTSVSEEGDITAYSYLQNSLAFFIWNSGGGQTDVRFNFDALTSRNLDLTTKISKVSHQSLEPRILVAGEQVPDIDIDIFSPVGVPPEVLDRIEIQRTPIRPKHLYFSRTLQDWTAPIYQTTYSPAFDSTGTRDVSTKDRYWGAYIEMLRDGREVTISIRLDTKRFRELDLLRPIFVRYFQARFVVRELKYEVGEDLHEVKLIKI